MVQSKLDILAASCCVAALNSKAVLVMIAPNSQDSARNLLFGLLAFQLNFIDRRALLAAFDDWTSNKSRDLGQVLVEQGALTKELRSMIEGLAVAHLAKHGNEPEKSLATLTLIGSVRKDLETLADSEAQESLALVTVDRSHDDDHFATRMPSVGTATSSGVRFKVLRPLNKGGMGVVSIALDTELDRSIALKEIRETAADNDEYRARFMAEAEITGKLEHPGIIPIYGLGTNEDGRPFYAMRLIRGDKTGSLMDAIERFYKEPGPDSSARIVVFRGLLGRFLDVCNALSYAHSKGVLHRDLKPDNILLGPYGETLVVDWGLAKAAGRADPAAPFAGDHIQLNLSGSELSPTLTGGAFGTPEYAPPEQMIGDLPNVGPRSDVYGLGAILYCLMTGQAPFSRKGMHLGALIVKIEAGEFPPPRQIRGDADKPLEAICLKAMSQKPADRYESVLALAADVEKYLADEPIAAYREPWTVRTRRWTKKHRTAVTSAAATLVVALGALTVGLVVVGGLNRKLDKVNTDLVGSNKKLDKANSNLATALETATERKKVADANFTLALDAVKAQVFDINNQLQNRPGTRDLREKLQKNAIKRLKSLIERASQRADADRTTMVAYMNLGDVYFRVDLKPSLARAEYQKAHVLAEMLAKVEPDDTQAQRDLSVSYRNLGDVTLQLGQVAKALEFYQKGRTVSEALAKADPANAQAQRDLSLSYRKLGEVTLQLGQAAQTLEFYQKALTVNEARAKADPADAQAQRDLSLSHEGLGDVTLQLGQNAKALEFFQKMRTVKEALAKADPADTQAQRDLSISYIKLGDVTFQLGQAAKALEIYQKGLTVSEARAKADPADTQAQRDLSIFHERLGNAALQLGQNAQALEFYEKMRTVKEGLAKADPADAQAQRDLSISYNNLGDVALRTGQSAKAIEYYTFVHDRCKKLADAAPTNDRAQRELSFVSLNLRLASVVQEDQQPKDGAERLALAQRSSDKTLYALAARFWDEALAADPKLGDDRKAGHRYNAACAAALAGSGRGDDMPKPDDAAKTKLRGQAHNWLKAEISAWEKVAFTIAPGNKELVAKTLAHWKQDADLAGVRDATAIDKLPEAERKEWQTLWAGVDRLLAQVR